jgi:hypothetical protein
MLRLQEWYNVETVSAEWSVADADVRDAAEVARAESQSGVQVQLKRTACLGLGVEASRLLFYDREALTLFRERAEAAATLRDLVRAL